MRTPPPNLTPRRPLPPCLALKSEPGQSNGQPAHDVEEMGDASGGSHIVCAACRHRITNGRARSEKGGRHRHVFFNPHGILFEMGVFSQASGCAVAGPPVAEFTWFPGNAWQPASCARCITHVGWRFTPLADGGETSFFGLILAQLVEEEGDGG